MRLVCCYVLNVCLPRELATDAKLEFGKIRISVEQIQKPYESREGLVASFFDVVGMCALDFGIAARAIDANSNALMDDAC